MTDTLSFEIKMEIRLDQDSHFILFITLPYIIFHRLNALRWVNKFDFIGMHINSLNLCKLLIYSNSILKQFIEFLFTNKIIYDNLFVYNLKFNYFQILGFAFFSTQRH